jgi:signal transduction histidine kinase
MMGVHEVSEKNAGAGSPNSTRQTEAYPLKRIASQIRALRSAILELWVEHAKRLRPLPEELSSHEIETVHFRDGIHEFLDRLAECMESGERVHWQDEKSQALAAAHGGARSGLKNYNLNHVIAEYQLLRQVLLEVLERERPLDALPRDIILDMISAGIGYAVAEFTRQREARERVSDLQLRESEARLSVVLARLPIGVAIASPDGRFLKANDAFFKIWGQPKEKSLSCFAAFEGYRLDTGNRLAPDDWPLARAIKKRETSLGEQLRILTFDGAEKIILNSAIPVYTDEGQCIGAVGVIQDITNQKRLEAELMRAKENAERASEMKSVFLANMSHEIRTPLGAMLGFADLLRDPSLTREETLSYIDILMRNGEQLSVIINDILDISKVEAGHLTLDYRPLSPDQLAMDVISLLKLKAEEKGLSLRYSTEASTPRQIISDPVRLRQILINVVGNAIKFTSHGGVTLRSYTESLLDGRTQLCFEVADSGIGIPRRQWDHIFEVFEQGDGSVTRRFGGTGLGLALSRRLARALGGDVTVLSSVMNHGSVFKISVLDEPEKQDTKVQTAALTGPRGQRNHAALGATLAGSRILVVDDAVDNRHLIKLYLQKQGAIVDFATNGFEGYKKALHGSHDLVLMDIQMPEMDGYTAISKLREAGYDKPIIALTAHIMNEASAQCLKVGCDDHLPKPINPQSLTAAIARQLHH